MKNRIIHIIVLLMVLGGSRNVQAQQESDYTNYMYNTGVINPAYAGTRNTTSFNMLHRNQWVGWDGAPVNNSFSADMAVGEDVGLGLTAVSDKIGPTVRYTYGVNAAYRLKLTRKIKISFGIRVGAENYAVDYSLLDPYNEADMLYANNVRSFNPLIGMGIYVYSDNMYFGFSTPQVFAGYYDGKLSNHGRSVSHYYGMAGYVKELTNDIKLKPSVLFKWTGEGNGNVFRQDIYALNLSLNCLLYEKLTIGAAYGLHTSGSGLVAYNVNSNLLAGYAYDFNLNGLQGRSGGSHEVFLRYEFNMGRNGFNVVNPRFF